MFYVPRFLTAATLAVSAVFAAPVMAEQNPVVVELYTSQGCSSCPPADEIFSQLRERDDVIAIALHVDYWDYIGWKDEFGQPAHAERQRAYAAQSGRRSIYTPEMIVNGQTDIVGAKPMALSNAIAAHKANAPRADVAARRVGDTVHIKAQPIAAELPVMDVHVLRLIPSKSSKITRGENRGKSFEYTNIAHSWSVAGQWDGTGPLDLALDVEGDDPVVVLLQAAGAGEIIAAARTD